MKNKNLVYVLLPLVIIIWGGIFYKVFQSKKTKVINEISNILNPGNIVREKEDTFSLILSDRDPFLGASLKFNRPKEKPSNPPKESVKEKVQTPWPQLIYNGFIKNNNSRKQLYLIRINDKEYTFKVGETIEGVSLKKVFKDSLLIIFNKQNKIIKK